MTAAKAVRPVFLGSVEGRNQPPGQGSGRTNLPPNLTLKLVAERAEAPERARPGGWWMGPTTLLGPPEDWEGTERNCTESDAGPKSSIAPR